jgi:pSer/pThr/pTyr-binding forkhead associated (FHA) protein
MPTLNITLPDGSQQTQELVEHVVTIGRVPDNSIQIDDASVSSHHAQLTLQGGNYVLQDTGSTNGTRLNGKSVTAQEEHPLQDGDQIRFGSIDVAYASEVESEARPMPVEEEQTLAAAASSSRPANFSNASPFQTKKKKKDPTTTALIAFAIVAFLVFAGAVASIFTLKAPVFPQ